jgi:hypothetical protein
MDSQKEFAAKLVVLVNAANEGGGVITFNYNGTERICLMNNCDFDEYNDINLHCVELSKAGIRGSTHKTFKLRYITNLKATAHPFEQGRL